MAYLVLAWVHLPYHLTVRSEHRVYIIPLKLSREVFAVLEAAFYCCFNLNFFFFLNLKVLWLIAIYPRSFLNYLFIPCSHSYVELNIVFPSLRVSYRYFQVLFQLFNFVYKVSLSHPFYIRIKCNQMYKFVLWYYLLLSVGSFLPSEDVSTNLYLLRNFLPMQFICGMW